MQSYLDMEDTAKKLMNPITGKSMCQRTIRNYINSGLLDAERKVNEKTGRVSWMIKESSLETLHERIEQRDKAMRKEYAARLQANKEIGRKRDEEDPSRKEKRNAAIRKKRKKAAKAAK